MSAHNVPDKRYTIGSEYGGWATAQFVVRFCGEFVSAHKYERDAETAAWDHHGRRLSDLRTAPPLPLGMERQA